VILFPGRHHLLTRFQAAYLRRLATAEEPIVWAVTSANHQNTKRNPVPFDRRQAAIERFSVVEGLRSLVVAVFDTAPTARFADVTLKTVEATIGRRPEPASCVVACSTPEVAAMYEALGFRIAGVELDAVPSAAERPWDVLLRLAAGDPSWRDLAHPATVDVYERYGLDELVRTVVNDPVVGDEGGLTTTRDYHTYAEAFEASAARKWEAARTHVRPGRIVDIGCGAGAVLALADAEPALRESDLIGVEVARHLFEECVHRKAQGGFANPNVYFYCRNVLGGAVFAPRSIDTTLTFALTHEIWSYGTGLASVRRFAEAMGFLEKTDRIDSGIIAWFAEVKRMGPQPPSGEAQRRLAALVTRLRQLTELRTAQNNQRRLVTDPTALGSFAELLSLVARQIKAIAEEIGKLIAADPLLAKARPRVARDQGGCRSHRGPPDGRVARDRHSRRQGRRQARRPCPAGPRQRQAQRQPPSPRRA